MGLSPWCSKGFFSQSTSSTDSYSVYAVPVCNHMHQHLCSIFLPESTFSVDSYGVHAAPVCNRMHQHLCRTFIPVNFQRTLSYSICAGLLSQSTSSAHSLTASVQDFYPSQLPAHTLLQHLCRTFIPVNFQCTLSYSICAGLSSQSTSSAHSLTASVQDFYPSQLPAHTLLQLQHLCRTFIPVNFQRTLSYSYSICAGLLSQSTSSAHSLTASVQDFYPSQLPAHTLLQLQHLCRTFIPVNFQRTLSYSICAGLSSQSTSSAHSLTASVQDFYPSQLPAHTLLQHLCRTFIPVNFQRTLSYSICAIACISWRAHVKNPQHCQLHHCLDTMKILHSCSFCTFPSKATWIYNENTALLQLLYLPQ